MKKTISMGTCTAIVGFAATALLAQTPQPPQTSTAPASSDQKVTITGCLKAAPASDTTASAAGAAGTTGTTGTTAGATGTSGAAEPSEAKFVLADATMKPASEATPGSTSPAETTTGAGATTSGAASQSASGAAAAGQTYRLIANPAALSAHVGKKLELTGTLEQNGSSASGAAGTTGAAGSSASAQGPALRVESGKVIAASCSPQ
jgi:pilus assembly protein FimV